MLRLIRINNLIFVAFFQIVLRYGVLLPCLQSYGFKPALTDWQFALLVTATVLLTASGNIINDYFDIVVDKINKPEKVVVDRILDRRTVILLHVLFTLIGVFIGLWLAFVLRREAYALMFIGIPVILWFYSTHFKRQMLVGNLVVSLLVALTAFVVVSFEFSALVRMQGGAILESEACNKAWTYTTTYAFFAFLTNLSREIVKDMEDMKGDAAGNCHTLPIEMGVGRSKIVVVLLQVLLVVMLWTVYACSHVVHSQRYIEIYLLILLTLPVLAVVGLIIRAKDKRDFSIISTIQKYTMLFGVLTALFFNIF